MDSLKYLTPLAYDVLACILVVVLGLKNLPPTTYYTVDSNMYIIRTGIKYHLSTKSEVITGKSQTEVNTLEVIFNFPLQAHRVIQGRVH